MMKGLFVLFLACAGAAHAVIWQSGDLTTSGAVLLAEPSIGKVDVEFQAEKLAAERTRCRGDGIDFSTKPAFNSAVPEPFSRMSLIIAAFVLGCTRWLRRRNSAGKGVMSFGAIGVAVLGGSLAVPSPAAADATAFTSVSVPAICGSVCTPPISQNNTGGVSGGILSSITSLDQVEFAEARINLTTGAAGVAVANDIGFSSANASHFDTWSCTDPIICAALATPGSFVPVTINLHVSGSASLTPGAMNVSYSYLTNSLLGSSALGTFQFNFGEDDAKDPRGNIGGTASFFDYHTGIEHDIPVDIVSQGFNTGMVAFSADLSVTSYIGGCVVAGCDLSKGIFTDVQGLSAQIDPGNDGSAQILNSLNTFQVGFTSDLPFVSADGRTAGAAVVATPEPNSLRLVLVAAVAALAWKARTLTSLLANWRVRVPFFYMPDKPMARVSDLSEYRQLGLIGRGPILGGYQA